MWAAVSWAERELHPSPAQQEKSWEGSRCGTGQGIHYLHPLHTQAAQFTPLRVGTAVKNPHKEQCGAKDSSPPQKEGAERWFAAVQASPHEHQPNHPKKSSPGPAVMLMHLLFGSQYSRAVCPQANHLLIQKPTEV